MKINRHPASRRRRDSTLSIGLVVAGFNLGLTGCATTTPASAKAPPDSHLSSVHRISVQPFDGNGSAAVTAAMIKHLLSQGFEVVDAQQPADAVLKGTVTDYRPNDTLMVFLGSSQVSTGKDKDQTVTVDNPILSFDGAHVTPDMAAMNLPTSQVVVQHATVGIAVTLDQPHTGVQWWTSDGLYEAIDPAQATDVVADALAKSLARVIIAAREKESHG